MLLILFSATMQLSHEDQNRERKLLQLCEESQGPAISGLNRRVAPGATTYRSEFCNAAADLFRLYANAGIKSPLMRIALQFNERGIESCRGNEMTPTVVNYFYHQHLLKRLR